MHRDDSEAVDRLDQGLDALVAGTSVSVEPWLDATDLRLRTLDTAFAPAEGMLMGIWDKVIDNVPTAAMGGFALNGAGGHAGPPLRDGGRTRFVDWWPSRWSVGAVSTVALVCFVLVAGYAAIQLAGIGDAGDGEDGPAGVAVASPSPDKLIVPPPSECTVEPRPMSFFEQFVTTPTSSEQHATFPVNGSSFDQDDLAAFDIETVSGDVVIHGGGDVDDETIAAITATVREFVACGNAGDGARTNALVTEEFVRRITGDAGIPANAVAELTASPTPREPDDWDGLYPIHDARLLDNGHIVAVFPLVDEMPDGESEIEYGVLVFVNIGDRWLIDGMAQASEMIAQRTGGKRIVPPPEDCTVEPLTWDEIESIAATQTADSPSPRQTSGIDPALKHELNLRREAGLLTVTGGEPTNSATIAEVQQVFNMFVACANAGEVGGGMALMSEASFGVFGTLSDEDAAAIRTEYEASPTPRPSDLWIGYYPITGARTFYSGHVVLIQPADINWLKLPGESIQLDPDDPYVLVSFIQEGDRWVIDSFQLNEARDLLEPPPSFPNARAELTAAPTPSPVVVTIESVPAPTVTPIASTVILIEPTTKSVLVPSPTPALAQELPPYALESTPIKISVRVDADGLLAGDPTAIEEATAALRDELADLPAGCRVGFVLTSGYADRIGEGDELAEAVNALLREEFPDHFSGAAFETLAFIDEPYGQVDLRLFVFSGCGDEASASQPTSVPEFKPTHQSNAQQQVNLRAGPGTDTSVVTTLTLAQPLQYLNEDAPTDNPASDGPRWMKFRTENGAVGWVREIDVEPIISPTRTPIR